MTEIDSVRLQQSFWNDWNASNREDAVGAVSMRQAEVVCGWLDVLQRKDLDIIDVGCGAGWFCSTLSRFGRVTGTDLSNEVLARARCRMPEVSFVPGDFASLEFGEEAFDVAVALEVLSHVADQRAFLRKLAGHLRPGGHLMIATQNRPVLTYLNRIEPPASGQLRRWVNRREFSELLGSDFDVLELFSVSPMFGRGVMGSMNLNLNLRGRLRKGGDDQRSQHPQGRAVPSRGRMTTCLETMGLGWTLMALARKR